MQLNDYLELLNLSEIEAKLYSLLIESGPTSVRELAEMASMKRTTAYLYVDQLIAKGLVMKVLQGSQKLVAVIDPEVGMKHLVDEKVHNAQILKDQFPNMLEHIGATIKEEELAEDADIKYFKGKNGVKKIYEDALRANELRSTLNFELINNALPDNGELFVNALQTNKNLVIYEIFQDTAMSRKKVATSQTNSLQHERYFKKFLPKGTKLSSTDILIYDDKVGIVNVGNQFTGTILKNKDYYNNLKELFDLIWNVLPKEEK